MRTSKIVALVATAALLVVGTAFASFAAGKTGWDNSEGVWKYYKNGEMVTSDWAKSGADYYYLDENGEMATDKLIEDTYIYYVDSEGKMVKGDWVKMANTDDDPTSEFVYYYFQKSGKAYTNNTSEVAFKTIDGKKYAFGDDGKMLWGWLTKNNVGLADDVNTDDASSWKAAQYYCGDANDGALKTGWVKLPVYDDGDADGNYDQEYYFYFASTGVKQSDVVKTIDGKKYAFGVNGNMLNSLVITSSSIATPNASKADSAQGYMYFSTAEDGARYAKKWFRVAPTAIMDSTDNAADEAHWFYAKSNATLAKSEMITWNGKNYAFAENGEMLAGLYVASFNNSKVMQGEAVKVEDINTVKTLTPLPSGANTYYFGDEATDGAMKTGSCKVELDGDEYAFKFKTSGILKGTGVQGLDGGCYYVNGVKIMADGDQKYQLYPTTAAPTAEGFTLSSLTAENASTKPASLANYVLISSTGAAVKSGTKKDADGYKIKVVTPYTVQSITDPS